MYSRISKELKEVVLPPRAEIAGLIPSTEVMPTIFLPGTFERGKAFTYSLSQPLSVEEWIRLKSKESDSAPSLVPLIRNLTSRSLFPLLRKMEASSSRKHLQTLRPASRARSLLSLLRRITYSGLSKPWNRNYTMAMFSDQSFPFLLLKDLSSSRPFTGINYFLYDRHD